MARNKREEFITKASSIHNHKYDYSKVEYTGSKKKVCIICPEHGEFLQTPSHHMQGQGCPECGKQKSMSSKKKDNANLICANSHYIKNMVYHLR